MYPVKAVMSVQMPYDSRPSVWMTNGVVRYVPAMLATSNTTTGMQVRR